MRIWGYLLIVLNLAAAGAFIYFGLQVFNARTEWQYALLKQELINRGLPVEPAAPPAEELDEGFVPFEFDYGASFIHEISKKQLSRFIPPGGDWMRILPSGVRRLDVRATLKTDDGALIYMSYNGVMQLAPEIAQKLMGGVVLKAEDIANFVAAPTFETSSPKYAWLNGIQAINKIVEVKLGDDGYVQYDVFIIR